MDVRVDSYFERLPEKDEIVPPIRNANPQKRKIIPNITSISASHRWNFLLLKPGNRLFTNDAYKKSKQKRSNDRFCKNHSRKNDN